MMAGRSDSCPSRWRRPARAPRASDPERHPVHRVGPPDPAGTRPAVRRRRGGSRGPRVERGLEGLATRFAASTVAMIASPGKRAAQGAVATIGRASRIIPPKRASGADPEPEKREPGLEEDDVAEAQVAARSTGPATLGRRWRPMIRIGLAPTPRRQDERLARSRRTSRGPAGWCRNHSVAPIHQMSTGGESGPRRAQQEEDEEPGERQGSRPPAASAPRRACPPA